MLASSSRLVGRQVVGRVLQRVRFGRVPTISSRTFALAQTQASTSYDRAPSQNEVIFKSNITNAKMPATLLALLNNAAKEGVEPDLDTYHLVMDRFAQLEWHLEIQCLIADAENAGVRLTAQTYNYLLQAGRGNIVVIQDTLSSMQQAGIEPDSITYEQVILHFIELEHLEMALQHALNANEKGVHLTRQTIEPLISLTAANACSRLALDLLNKWETSETVHVSNATLVDVLSSAADAHYVEGVLDCWRKLDGTIQLDEGLCLSLLHVAARHGQPDLATDMLQALSKAKVPLQEQHLVPLMEAFAAAGQFKPAFAVIRRMRALGITPSLETTSYLFKSISTSSDDVDKAFAAMEELKRSGEPVDIAAFNALVQSCVALDDLTRVVGTFQEAPSLGLVPNVETYNVVLSACVQAQHQALGERIFQELKANELQPDGHTFERMIVLSLTQPTYEEAFEYLEDMKAAMFKPPATIYEAIIRKCLSKMDTRWKIALEEMTEQGYKLSLELKTHIDSL